MLRTLVLVTALTVIICGLTLDTASAFFAGPIGTQNDAAEAALPVQRLTFWGHPYPYGYAWYRRCDRRVKVRTAHGWRYVRDCRSVVLHARG